MKLFYRRQLLVIMHLPVFFFSCRFLKLQVTVKVCRPRVNTHAMRHSDFERRYHAQLSTIVMYSKYQIAVFRYAINVLRDPSYGKIKRIYNLELKENLAGIYVSSILGKPRDTIYTRMHCIIVA